jgi:hypothetical protein
MILLLHGVTDQHGFGAAASCLNDNLHGFYAVLCAGHLHDLFAGFLYGLTSCLDPQRRGYSYCFSPSPKPDSPAFPYPVACQGL